ncbi:FkbM family methyltransferase [Nitratidesulfovibrio liaohensis]|uniref:FkbM family methyltransferase n=1 Tax=Nitratidesulfovibrio liaohensis TaxID=2604158 RepID=A0ABY9QXQ9_9BACT|nr:FkbM family methyltransferase [Nitratidesulfovibrio liaohensis]WMW64097.1 FkbM family methyltransferase [Nitratidesulfovibrio liaohensis]
MTSPTDTTMTGTPLASALPDMAGLSRCNPRLAAWFAWSHDDWQGADAAGGHVHLGCGGAVLDGFVNLDFLPHDARVRECRLLDVWPRRLAGQVAAFYAEDVIEHFFLTEQLYILCSMNVLLRPGGVARLLTPDIGQLWTYGQRFDAATLVGSGDYFADVMRCRNGMDAVNTGLRMGGHRWLHDFTSLRRAAEECGFAARRTPCATSDDPKLCNINLRDESGISFAAELRKTRPLRHLLVWPERIANAVPVAGGDPGKSPNDALPSGLDGGADAIQPVFRATTGDPGITYRLPDVAVQRIAMVNVRSANLSEFREHNFAKAYFRLEESGAVYADRTLHSVPHMNGFTRADVETAMRGEGVLRSVRFDPSEREGDLFTVGPLELFLYDDAAEDTADMAEHPKGRSMATIAADIAPDATPTGTMESGNIPMGDLPAHLEDHVMATPCRQGVIHHFDFDGPVGMALAIYGEWAQAELDALAPYAPAGGRVLDVGSNVGTHAVAFARMVGASGQVTALEPQAEVFALLQRTVAVNNLAGVVTPVRAGAAGRAGTARVPRIVAPEGQNLGAVRLLDTDYVPQDATHPTDEIPLLTIDGLGLHLPAPERPGTAGRLDLIKPEAGTADTAGRLDLIKIDAEGDEAAILCGAADTIRACRPVLHLECPGFARAWPCARQALAWGYAVFHLRLPAFNPANFRGASRNVFGAAEEGALLCIPRERLEDGSLPAPCGTEIRDPAHLARALLETRAYGQPEERIPAATRLDLVLSDLRRKRAEEHCVAANARSGRQHGRITTLRTAARAAEALLAGTAETAGAESTTACLGIVEDAHARLLAALDATAPERPAITEPDTREPWPAPPDITDKTAWAELAARRAELAVASDGTFPRPVIDVIVPVYAGTAQTPACLHSILRADLAPADAAAPRAHVVAVNDASPEPELAQALRSLAALGLVELMEHSANKGFVASVNAGMALHPDRDVVLLNSDTVVFPGWLSRMAAHLTARPDAGSVTPLSNNATICSYPVTERDNRAGLELDSAALDALAATVNAGVAVDIPTAVGFCMLIRRACLTETGPFDEATFGRGYGEENDFCMRAAALGWRHLLAADVFVRHAGEMSFGDDAAPLKEAAFATIQRMYPDYLRTVAAHCAADPARPARRALDLARLRGTLARRFSGTAHARGGDAARPVLMVTHNWGGGTERHVQDLCDRLATEGTPALVLRPRGNDAGCVWTLNLPASGHAPACGAGPARGTGPLHLPNLTFDLPPDFGALLEVLADLRVAHIHVHNLAGYPHATPELLPLMARLLEIPCDVTAHDLSALCPRITCIGPDGYPCPTALDGNEKTAHGGHGAPWRCATCIAAETPQLGNTDIVRWRAAWGTLLDGARVVFTPSGDTARRLAAHFPGCAARITVRPHPETSPLAHVSVAHAAMPHASATGHAGGTPTLAASSRGTNDALRVAVIGAIGPHKGSHVLEACARHAREAGLPLHFTVVGYTDRDDVLRELGVTVTGRYDADELPGLLAACGDAPYHLAFLPAVWPETYSYTLSEAVLAGLYPVTFDLGAPAERMAAWNYGLRLPVALVRDPAAINAALLACTPAAPPAGLARAILAAGDYPAPFRASYYGMPDAGKPGGNNAGDNAATPAQERA